MLTRDVGFVKDTTPHYVVAKLTSTYLLYLEGILSQDKIAFENFIIGISRYLIKWVHVLNELLFCISSCVSLKCNVLLC